MFFNCNCSNYNIVGKMVKENLVKIASTVPEPTRLIAVSKTKPVEMLQEAYDAGQRLFGENKAL